jgi:hypothetical protein
MTGIRVLRGGGIETNLGVLNEDFALGQIDGLIDRKRRGTERQLLKNDELLVHNRELDELENILQSAFDESKLPDEPTTMKELNDFIIRARLRSFHHSAARAEYFENSSVEAG